MEETAQRIRRLARDLCPGEPLGKKGCSANGVSAFTVVSLDSTCIKVHPDGMGALKKTALSLSEEHGADGTPNFIWSPHLIEMG